MYVTSYGTLYNQLHQEIATANTWISPTQRRWCSSRLRQTRKGRCCHPQSPTCEHQLLRSPPRMSHNARVKNPFSSHVWPPLQTSSTSHCPDPKLFPFPRYFINCLRLCSQAALHTRTSNLLLLSRDKALTSLLCSTGFHTLVTIMVFALF